MNRATLTSLTACLLSAALSGPVHAEEGFDPARFVADKCSSCHDSSVYTRSNRRVNSLPALQRQVRMCDANVGTRLFDDDLHTLVNHLNDQYYHFK